MSAIPFDTLKFVKRLEASGVPVAQAEATAEAFAEATSQELATKSDLSEMKTELKGEIAILKWMVGFILAGVGSLILKSFFHG